MICNLRQNYATIQYEVENINHVHAFIYMVDSECVKPVTNISPTSTESADLCTKNNSRVERSARKCPNDNKLGDMQEINPVSAVTQPTIKVFGIRCLVHITSYIVSLKSRNIPI